MMRDGIDFGLVPDIGEPIQRAIFFANRPRTRSTICIDENHSAILDVLACIGEIFQQLCSRMKNEITEIERKQNIRAFRPYTIDIALFQLNTLALIR